jgi:hypothetical protein
MTLLGVILAPIFPFFATSQEGWLDNHSTWGMGPRLPIWLNWFQTPDNSLDGDATFEKLNPPSYLSKIKWLVRNPAYAFGLKYLVPPYQTSVYGDKLIKDNDGAKEGWCFVKANGLFQFTLVKRIFSTSRCVYVNLGWNVRGLVDDNVVDKPNPWQATFVFSPRISGFR